MMKRLLLVDYFLVDGDEKLAAIKACIKLLDKHADLVALLTGVRDDYETVLRLNVEPVASVSGQSMFACKHVPSNCHSANQPGNKPDNKRLDPLLPNVTITGKVIDDDAFLGFEGDVEVFNEFDEGAGDG